MKKLITVLVLLAVAGGGAYYYYSVSNTVEPPQIVKATVSQGNVTEFVQATGTLEARRTVQVGPQVSGTIVELGPDFNSIVRAGQVIARLDPSLLQVQVDIQTANIERQETDIELQRVQLQDTERSLQRTKELFDKGLANQTQLEQADLAVKQRQAQIASAEKSLVQARANLAQARLNVSYTEVKSPIDGVVVNRRVDIGQSVQSSMNITPFYDIATDLKNLRLSAGVDESEIGKIRQGMPVTFQVDTYPNTTFRGTVSTVRLNAATANNVVTYPVWIDVPNDDLRLRPGLTATLRVIINTATDVVRIPNQALRFRPSNEMYTALGLTPPEPPAGGGRGRGGEGRGGNGDPTAAAAPAAAAPPSAQAAPRPQPPAAAQQASAEGRQGRGDAAAGQFGQGRGGQGRGGQAPQVDGGQGRNGGGRGNFANLSPEERQRLMAAGGRNGGRGGRGGTPPPPMTVQVSDEPDQKIDSMFAPLQVRPTPGQVWTWDEATRTLKDIRVTTGLNDGQFQQLLSGDVPVGTELVTNIILPVTAAQRAAQQQSIFGGQQGRGGFGGPQPGGPGGGGGGNRGGGGGGGRGGF
jgi:HlyD family secretion protein